MQLRDLRRRQRRLRRQLRWRIGARVAPAWRRARASTTFVAITGSAAKTTTKELIAAVLARTGEVARNPAVHNEMPFLVGAVLSVRSRHRYCVVEIPAWGPDTMDELLALARPSVGVVTCVGIDHRSAFRTLDAVAEEKGKLVARLPADGLAVLNADDPLVIAMAARTAARVVTFGTSVGAEVRAVDARGTWPDRLTFELEWKGETHTVATRLCGLHWTTAVVAALAVGFELGVPVADAIAAVSEVEPVDGRMRPETVDGVTFVFDDAKNPQWSLPIALQFMADAEAERKIVVLGPLSDYSDKAEPANRRAAAAALGVAEIVIGTGHHAKYMARARSDDDRVPVLAETVDEVDAVLAPMLRPGDLVYVRGGRKIGLGSLARRHAARVTAS